MSDKKTQVAKTFASTYLYNLGDYESRIFNYVMTAERVDKKDPSFNDIKYEVKKRNISSSLNKLMDSDKVVLMLPPVPMAKAFKIITCSDVKENNTLKVFIDCTGIISKDNGEYKCNYVDRLIAHLLSAMNQFIYYSRPLSITMREGIISSGAKCFSSLFTHIVDYLYKVSIVTGTKDKCIYLSALYYVRGILGKEITDSVKALCRKISNISEREEEILLIKLDQDKAFVNIKFFIEELSKVLTLPKLTLDVFLEKWIFVYGTGTQFALELYPSFATMITDVYVGCYINNQKTIEKVVGKDMIDFTNNILRIGAEMV